ncbi:MAG: hypothetical protein V5A21_00685 [Halapricum sp.]
MTDNDRSDMHTQYRRNVGYVLVTVALLLITPITGVTTGVAAQTETTETAESSLSVALEEDGSARVMLTVPFDLATDVDRQAFETLRENTTLREQRTDQFATRIETVAEGMAVETERDVRVHDGSIEFTERNGTGLVRFSVTWDGLAARQGDRLVMSEPFSSGFTADRQFRVVGPDGYGLANVTPPPSEEMENAAVWSAGSTLDGFEVVFAPTVEGAVDTTATDTRDDAATTGIDTGSGDGPGFGVAIALLAALFGVVLVISRTGG